MYDGYQEVAMAPRTNHKSAQLQVKLDPMQQATIREAAQRLIAREQEGTLAGVYRSWLLAAARKELARQEGTGMDAAGNPYTLGGE
jgi:hypothetical protein